MISLKIHPELPQEQAFGGQRLTRGQVDVDSGVGGVWRGQRPQQAAAATEGAELWCDDRPRRRAGQVLREPPNTSIKRIYMENVIVSTS